MADDHPVFKRRRLILRQHGLAELRDLAADLHARRRRPAEIWLALIQRARLLAEARDYPLHPLLPIVRQLPGLAPWNPDAEAEAVEAEWRGRALALADWLTRHAGRAIAEDVVFAAEAIALEHVAGEEAL